MNPLNWRNAISKAAVEFPLSKLSLLEGQVPRSLQGSLYRNGPARLERGGQYYNHWFDGDGAILKVSFQDGEAFATYKYIHSDPFKQEEAANKILFAGFAQTMPGSFFAKIFARKYRNAGNTSVLCLPDRLLALYEGGWPYSLNSENLDTIGPDNLGFLAQRQFFSAHPKVDYETGEIYNIGLSIRSLCIYRCDKHGKLIKKNQINYRPNMFHDFVLAGKYLVVMSFPTKVRSLPLLALGLKSFGELLDWTPQLGTEILVFDRNDLSLVSKFKTDSFYAFHFTNGYEEDGIIHLEFVKYDEYDGLKKFHSTIPNLKKKLPPVVTGRLTSMRINPKEGKVLETKELYDKGKGVEFPTVANEKVGKSWRYSLFNTTPQTYELEDCFYSGVGKYDQKTQEVQTYDYGEGRYASEPILTGQVDESDKGFIVSVVFDAKDKRSEVCIHDRKELQKGPVCRLALPEIIPPSFHGKWQPKEEIM